MNFSALFTVVQILHSGSSQVSGNDFPSLRDEDLSALGTPLGSDTVGPLHRDFHDKPGIRLLTVALEVLVVDGGQYGMSYEFVRAWTRGKGWNGADQIWNSELSIAR